MTLGAGCDCYDITNLVLVLASLSILPMLLSMAALDDVLAFVSHGLLDVLLVFDCVVVDWLPLLLVCYTTVPTA